MRRAVLAGTWLIMAILVAGCAPPKPPPPTSSPRPVPAQSPGAAETPGPLAVAATVWTEDSGRAESIPAGTSGPARPAATPGRPITLGLAVPDGAAEPWRSLAYGAEDEAVRRGVELARPPLTGSSPPEEQARQIRELVDRRVDLILLVGGEGPVVSAALDYALARGVPIGALSSLVSVEKLVFKVGPDRYAQGRLQAECLGAALGGRGAVGLLTGPPDDLAAVEPAQGFRETIRKRFPNIHLTVERAASLDRAAAGVLITGWLAERPNLTGLAADREAAALGALNALWTAGRLGQLKVAMLQPGPIAEHALRDGGLHCAVAQQAVAEGRVAVRTALDYLAGQPYERNVKSPPVLLTRDSLDRIDLGLLRAPEPERP